jgi:hypothetical protein
MIKIFEFLRPEYLKILNSLFWKSVIKNNCVEIKKINGNISNISVGEFKRERYTGKRLLTFSFLKKSSSLSKFNMNIRLNIIINT